MKIKIGQEQISYLNSLDNTELKKEFLMDYFISQCEEIVKKEEESVTKTKLNKQQKKYIKACDSKELRKELKRFFKKENQLLQEAKDTPIVFKNGVFRTNNPIIIKYLNGLLSVKPFEKTSDTIIWNDRFVEDKNSLTKETLESLTNPDLIEKKKDFEDCIENHLIKVGYCGKVDWDQKIEKEIRETLEFDLPKTYKKIDELLNTIKLTYSQEDMLNCFQESRLTHPMVGFKHDSFASYLESLK